MDTIPHLSYTSYTPPLPAVDTVPVLYPDLSLLWTRCLLSFTELITFVGKGNLDGSAVLGVWMAVKGGGHEWVIS